MANIDLHLHRLVLYRKILNNEVIKKTRHLLEILQHPDDYPRNELEEAYCDVWHQLIKQALESGLKGDVWKKYVLSLVLSDENAFSLACEKVGIDIDRGLFDLAVYDIEHLRELYSLDWSAIGCRLGMPDTSFIGSFHGLEPENMFYRQRTEWIERIGQVFEGTAPARTLAEHLAEFYHRVGCGDIGRYAAFRWDNGLKGIDDPDATQLEDLVGCEYQKEVLIANTETFLKGLPANNVLLYGEKGTGKSSSVKGLLTRYACQGLRMVELSKEQLADYPRVVQSVKNRGFRFIIFIDDLSFEDFEVEYKHAKAAIEGSLQSNPKNVLLYATSNRRHLVRENWSDRQRFDEEIHISDSHQEKLSFADRFGITLRYQAPSQEQYLRIVQYLAQKAGLGMPDEKLRKQAVEWEMKYHGRSGRTARQFINYLLGQAG